MKTNKYIISVLFSALLAFTACNENDFLSISNPNEISTADYPISVTHCSALLTSAYGQIHDWNFYGSVVGSYVYFPLEYDVDWQWRDSDTWIGTLTKTNTGPSERICAVYSPINKGIHYCNVAIEGIMSYMESAPESEQNQLKNFLGEAYFLRAFYWWHLLDIYGQPDLNGVGIPILEHSSKSYTDAQIGRSTTEESYKAIVRSLETAIPLLEGQSNKYRADKWAAIGLLAKTYFFMGDKENAKTYCEQIIHQSGKQLVSYNSMRNMYNGDAAYEHPSESLFEIDNVMSSTYNEYNAEFKIGSEFSRWDTHCSLSANGKRSSMDNANVYCHDKNLARFGYSWAAPGNYFTQNAEEGMLPYTVTQDDGWYVKKSYIEENLAAKYRAINGKPLATDPDPRFYVCVMMPFIDSCKRSGGVEWGTISQNIKTASGGNLWWEVGQNGTDKTIDYAFPTRKYKFLGGALSSDGNNCSGENIYFMRLSEIYLIYAQILKDSGNQGGALEYVNKVHRRAYGEYGESSDYDYKTLTDRTKTLDPNDQLANDPLKYELWAELFGEMKWWDYIRYYRLGAGEAKYYEKAHGAGNTGITYCKFPDYQYAQPIPSSEIEYNKQMIQTPGYLD